MYTNACEVSFIKMSHSLGSSMQQQILLISTCMATPCSPCPFLGKISEQENQHLQYVTYITSISKQACDESTPMYIILNIIVILH